MMEDESLNNTQESILVSSSLCLLSLQQLSDDIEKSVLPSLDQDRSELEQFFKKIDNMHDLVIPAVTKDLIDIERLVDSLETKLHNQVSGKSAKKSEWGNIFSSLYDITATSPRTSGSSREYKTSDSDKASTGLLLNVHTQDDLISLLEKGV